MTDIERFESLLQEINRDGMDKLLKYLKSSDMYTAPSSTRFHLSVKGGLLKHSLNVYDALVGFLRDNEDGTYSLMTAGKEVSRISRESLLIITLLHDICKTHFYTVEKRNKKIDGVWHEVDTFAIDDKFPYGHGEKSVMMIESCIRLKMEERMAIRWHMGFPEGYSERQTFSAAVDQFPMVWALHNADMMAAHFMEDTENNKEAFREI